MKFNDLFKLSIRMFKARTSRTLLTILGMSIGISAILFMVSFGYGLQRTLLEKITTSDSLLTLDVFEQKSNGAFLNKDLLDEFSNISGVAEISPAFEVKSQANSGNITAELNVLGITASFLRLGGFKIAEGSGLDDENENNIVITSAVSQIFGKENYQDMIGQEVKLSFLVPENSNQSEDESTEKFKKIESERIFKISGIIIGDDTSIYANLNSLGELGTINYNQVKVKCESQGAMGVIRPIILEKGFSVSSISDSVDQANKVFRVVQIILMLFGFIALAISAVGMFNTMTIALLERTEEIGIMKSIGASDLSISSMFIMESTIMGFLGGLGGIVIGLLSGEICNRFVNIIAVRFGGESVRLFYSPWWFILIVVSFSAIVGFITGFIPARRASKIDPLEALRYK